MMRRSMYVLMVCAAAAGMAQAHPEHATPATATPAAQPATPATQATPATPATPAAQAASPAPLEPVVVPPVPVADPLTKTDTLVGKGLEATVGAKVFVHYTGWLFKPMAKLQHGRKFDSSLERGEPLEFVLGTGRVIKGWDQGIVGMRVGGKRTLIIPSQLAYGSRGAGTTIPPGADLIFDVHLVDVK